MNKLNDFIEESEKDLIKKHKEKQLEIIKRTNPAPNTYLTWIRNIADIKTFEEAMKYEELYTPDYTEEMAKHFLKEGIIEVYSSYPIKQGVFVTPSYMEAKCYAGSGKIYSKTVSLNCIAWIDTLQGQYANVEEF